MFIGRQRTFDPVQALLCAADQIRGFMLGSFSQRTVTGSQLSNGRAWPASHRDRSRDLGGGSACSGGSPGSLRRVSRFRRCRLRLLTHFLGRRRRQGHALRGRRRERGSQRCFRFLLLLGRVWRGQRSFSSLQRRRLRLQRRRGRLVRTPRRPKGEQEQRGAKVGSLHPLGSLDTIVPAEVVLPSGIRYPRAARLSGGLLSGKRKINVVP